MEFTNRIVIVASECDQSVSITRSIIKDRYPVHHVKSLAILEVELANRKSDVQLVLLENMKGIRNFPATIKKLKSKFPAIPMIVLPSRLTDSLAGRLILAGAIAVLEGPISNKFAVKNTLHDALLIYSK